MGIGNGGSSPYDRWANWTVVRLGLHSLRPVSPGYLVPMPYLPITRTWPIPSRPSKPSFPQPPAQYRAAGEILVELGHIDREVCRGRRRRRARIRQADRRVPRRQGRHHRGPARRGAGVPLRRRPRPPAELRDRHGRRQPDRPDVAKRLEAVPVGFIGQATLHRRQRDPANVVAIDDIAMLTGYNVPPGRRDARRHPRADRPPQPLRGRRREAPDEESAPADGVELSEAAGDAPSQARQLDHRPGGRARARPTSTSSPAEGGSLDVRLRVDGVMTDSTPSRPARRPPSSRA